MVAGAAGLDPDRFDGGYGPVFQHRLFGADGLAGAGQRRVLGERGLADAEQHVRCLPVSGDVERDQLEHRHQEDRAAQHSRAHRGSRVGVGEPDGEKVIRHCVGLRGPGDAAIGCSKNRPSRSHNRPRVRHGEGHDLLQDERAEAEAKQAEAELEKARVAICESIVRARKRSSNTAGLYSVETLKELAFHLDKALC